MVIAENEDNTLSLAWEEAVENLQRRDLLPASSLAFVRLTVPVGIINDTVLLAVGSDFAKEFLETRVREPLNAALSDAVGQEVRFAVTVDPSLDDNVADPQSPAPQARPDEDHQPEPEPAPAPRAESPPPPQEPEPARPEAAPTAVNNDALGVVDPHARLNPNYTFETFVIGASNRFAHAAATASPGSRPCVQPVVHLRAIGTREDSPAARDRSLRPEPLPGCAGPVRDERGVHERLHQLDPG